MIKEPQLKNQVTGYAKVRGYTICAVRTYQCLPLATVLALVHSVHCTQHEQGIRLVKVDGRFVKYSEQSTCPRM